MCIHINISMNYSFAWILTYTWQIPYGDLLCGDRLCDAYDAYDDDHNPCGTFWSHCHPKISSCVRVLLCDAHAWNPEKADENLFFINFNKNNGFLSCISTKFSTWWVNASMNDLISYLMLVTLAFVTFLAVFVTFVTLFTLLEMTFVVILEMMALVFLATKVMVPLKIEKFH